MIEQLATDFIKVTLQLLLLGAVGGAVSWYYSKVQKQERAAHVFAERLRQPFTVVSSPGDFVSTPFMSNAVAQEVAKTILSVRMKFAMNWAHFEEVCSLIGEFYGIKPLLQSQFHAVHDELELAHGIYQQWRRQIAAAIPFCKIGPGEAAIDSRSSDQHISP